MADTVTVEELLQGREESLGLELLTPGLSLARSVTDPDLTSPGLALAGYVDRLRGGRMQVLGETELAYLGSLGRELSETRLQVFLQPDIPAVFITKGLQPPEALLHIARQRGIPVIRSSLSTRDFYRKVKTHLEAALAPSTSIHGSLADVFGVGLLFVGRSGIGKSECVLDLVERGHRFVADDLVLITRRGNDILIGRGHELQHHHMEIRGIGIIDIRALFGIQAVRQQKRIEVVVQLEEWNNERQYDRPGLDREEISILGVNVPQVTIPLVPGKNLTVLSEVVAMNHLLRYTGVDSAVEFDRRLKAAMRTAWESLEEDYE